MAYNENLANRIRQKLAKLPNMCEKEMMGGLTFMVNDKMCIGVIKDEMMCRLDPVDQELLLEKNGCRAMDFTKRPMPGYFMIDNSGMESDTDFSFWIDLALKFNQKAKSSKKPKG